MKTSVVRYIAIVLLIPFTTAVPLLIAIAALQEKLPAPSLSNSISFNYKARWLREHMKGRCDILVIGSSMALNNVNPAVLATAIPGAVIINTASWGMTIEESSSMLSTVAPLCGPKMVMLITYHGDFSPGENRSILWRQFEQYLHGDRVGAIYAYLRYFNLSSFISDLAALKQAAPRPGQAQVSLAFDGTGTIQHACLPHKQEPPPWVGYKYDVLSFSPSAFQALGAIAKTARAIDSRFVVVTTPMRPLAERSVDPGVRNALWDDVRKLVEAEHGTYIRVSVRNGFEDDMFHDIVHLNACGADRLTQTINAALAPR